MNADVSAARVIDVQCSLFPTAPKEVCERIGLKLEAAVKLYKNGWLSFNPRSVSRIEEDNEAELLFVGSLVACGCNEAMLKKLLADLQKPYCYRPNQIYFDWVAKKWRLIPDHEDPVPEEVFTDWLDVLAGDGAIRKIRELKTAILNAETECQKTVDDP